MSPTDRDTIFDLKDMHLIGFQCPKCGTEIIFNVAKENTGIPMKCPTCSKEFGEVTMEDILGTYRRVYQGASKSELHFTFRVRESLAVSKRRSS